MGGSRVKGGNASKSGNKGGALAVAAEEGLQQQKGGKNRGNGKGRGGNWSKVNDATCGIVMPGQQPQQNQYENWEHVGTSPKAYRGRHERKWEPVVKDQDIPKVVLSTEQKTENNGDETQQAILNVPSPNRRRGFPRDDTTAAGKDTPTGKGHKGREQGQHRRDADHFQQGKFCPIGTPPPHAQHGVSSSEFPGLPRDLFGSLDLYSASGTSQAQPRHSPGGKNVAPQPWNNCPDTSMTLGTLSASGLGSGLGYREQLRATGQQALLRHQQNGLVPRAPDRQGSDCMDVIMPTQAGHQDQSQPGMVQSMHSGGLPYLAPVDATLQTHMAPAMYPGCDMNSYPAGPPPQMPQSAVPWNTPQEANMEPPQWWAHSVMPSAIDQQLQLPMAAMGGYSASQVAVPEANYAQSPTQSDLMLILQQAVGCPMGLQGQQLDYMLKEAAASSQLYED